MKVTIEGLSFISFKKNCMRGHFVSTLHAVSQNNLFMSFADL